jgi:predicted Rossmann fold flavoprotein
VTNISNTADRFIVHTPATEFHASRVVLATGGQSLPKSGSDGAGYEFARRLGHTVVPTTPALVPLVLTRGARGAIHEKLSGISHDVELAVWVDDAVAIRLRGSLLWTHFGISGPVVLNASRHWLRARLEQRPVRMTMTVFPGASFEQIDSRLVRWTKERPKGTLRTLLGGEMPAAVAAAMLQHLELDEDRQGADLSKDERRRLVHALVAWPLPVEDSRGWNYAEATAGGVALDEIDPATMASRRCRGLSLVGEVLDVDGRIGGFNFQWAWATGRAAADGLGRE